MELPIQKNVFEALKPYHSVFAEVVYGAWTDWLSIYGVKPINCPRARASLIWSFMADRARLAFSSNKNVYIKEGHGTVSYIVGGAVLFRFKKGDEKGLSKNYPTPMALSYHRHDKSLFGPLDPDRVEVVYILNSLETDIDRVMVVARLGDSVLWAYDIEEKHELKIAELPIERPENRKEEELWKDASEAQEETDNTTKADTE